MSSEEKMEPTKAENVDASPTEPEVSEKLNEFKILFKSQYRQ